MSGSRHHHSSSAGGPSRVIFIGNIPFDITEEQVIDIFKEVGPVQSFRLMFDRETGRSRGFAFCEYGDYETAASAIRNLNGYEINGRVLKVDRADNDMLPSHFSSSSSSNPTTSAPQIKPVQNLPGTAPSASASSIHAILSVPPFNDPQNLLEVLASLKATIQSNPNQARQMLDSNPALAYALLQSFVALNLVDMSTVQSLLIQSQQAIQNRPVDGAAPSQAADQQRNLIMQIMSMTPEQINMLPPAQRDQVLQLRQQITQQQQQQLQARQ